MQEIDWQTVTELKTQTNPQKKKKSSKNKNEISILQPPSNVAREWEERAGETDNVPLSSSEMHFNVDKHLKRTQRRKKKSSGRKARLQMSENVRRELELWVCVYRRLKTDWRNWREREKSEREVTWLPMMPNLYLKLHQQHRPDTDTFTSWPHLLSAAREHWKHVYCLQTLQRSDKWGTVKPELEEEERGSFYYDCKLRQILGTFGTVFSWWLRAYCSTMVNNSRGWQLHLLHSNTNTMITQRETARLIIQCKRECLCSVKDKQDSVTLGEWKDKCSQVKHVVLQTKEKCENKPLLLSVSKKNKEEGKKKNNIRKLENS